jgi:hypothetical protein
MPLPVEDPAHLHNHYLFEELRDARARFGSCIRSFCLAQEKAKSWRVTCLFRIPQGRAHSRHPAVITGCDASPNKSQFPWGSQGGTCLFRIPPTSAQGPFLFSATGERLACLGSRRDARTAATQRRTNASQAGSDASVCAGPAQGRSAAASRNFRA